jgi:hypothetical protein
MLKHVSTCSAVGCLVPSPGALFSPYLPLIRTKLALVRENALHISLAMIRTLQCGGAATATATRKKPYADVGHAVPQWLRHYATSRKVAGSRADEVN